MCLKKISCWRILVDIESELSKNESASGRRGGWHGLKVCVPQKAYVQNLTLEDDVPLSGHRAFGG